MLEKSNALEINRVKDASSRTAPRIVCIRHGIDRSRSIKGTNIVSYLSSCIALTNMKLYRRAPK